MNLTIDKKMISALLNKGLSNKQKHAFFVELHLLISSGLDLKNTLELIAKGSDKAIIRTVEKLEKAVIQGLSLHDAMDRSGKFSTFEINAVKVGEETGNLRIVTRSVAEFYEKKNQLRRQFVGALTYPVLVIMVAFVVLYFMLSYVVPMFGNIFTRFDSELPESTQTILNLSNWLSGNQANLAIGVVLVLALFFILKRRPGVQEGFHRVLIRLPFFWPGDRALSHGPFCPIHAFVVAVEGYHRQSLIPYSRNDQFYTGEKCNCTNAARFDQRMVPVGVHGKRNYIQRTGKNPDFRGGVGKQAG